MAKTKKSSLGGTLEERDYHDPDSKVSITGRAMKPVRTGDPSMEILQDDSNSDIKTLPLCVGLDGTLANTDTMMESLLGSMQRWSVLIPVPG